MHKIKELLRLQFLRLNQHQIANSCAITQSTVSAHLKAAAAAGLRWPDVEDWDQARLEQALYPAVASKPASARTPAPDFTDVHQELQTNKHVPALAGIPAG